MGGTSTTAEAVAALQAALGAWGQAAAGIAAQTSAAATAAAGQAESEVRRRASKKAALQAALAAAQEEERAHLARQVELAEMSLESARRALNRATEARSRAQALQRHVSEATSHRVPSAMQELSRKLTALSDYSAARVPGSSGTTDGGGRGSSRHGYGVQGIVDVPIENATFDDNPILDGYHRGGADVGDYRWAVETWETVVRPGVLAGKTREDFQSRDAAMGRHTGFRRTAGVYDMFLGSDPIQFSRRADGSLDVASGRHRVEVARQLGIKHLPGRLHE